MSTKKSHSWRDTIIPVPPHDLKPLILLQDNPCPDLDGNGFKLCDVTDFGPRGVESPCETSAKAARLN